MEDQTRPRWGLLFPKPGTAAQLHDAARAAENWLLRHPHATTDCVLLMAVGACHTLGFTESAPFVHIIVDLLLRLWTARPHD